MGEFLSALLGWVILVMGLQGGDIKGMPLAVTNTETVQNVACQNKGCKDIITMDENGLVYIAKEIDWSEDYASMLLVRYIVKHLQFEVISKKDKEEFKKRTKEFEDQQRWVLRAYIKLLEEPAGAKINHYE